MTMETILIIDDEVGVVELLERFLRLEGFPTVRALTGAAALAAIAQRPYNLVLCAIRLPDIDGRELLVKLKIHNPLVNVVMIAGHTEMHNVVVCLGDGAADYFIKPFSAMDELLAALKELNRKIQRWKKMIRTMGR